MNPVVEIRRGLGLSRAELAHEAGVSERDLTEIEVGNWRISKAVATRLARLCAARGLPYSDAQLRAWVPERLEEKRLLADLAGAVLESLDSIECQSARSRLVELAETANALLGRGGSA